MGYTNINRGYRIFIKKNYKRKKLGWATDAIVYDEQPVGFRQSWSQRTRWSVGHIQCIQKYTKELAKGVKEYKTLMNFDGLLYILGSIPMFIIAIVLLLINAIMYLNNGMTTSDLILNYARYIIPTFSYQY